MKILTYLFHYMVSTPGTRHFKLHVARWFIGYKYFDTSVLVMSDLIYAYSCVLTDNV